MIKKENLPECPVATTVQLIGSKWKLLILRDLMTEKKRYNELRRIIRWNFSKSFNCYA